jgi:tRNA(fMet)-specific endonuclease VapC
MEEEIVLCDTNVYIQWFNGSDNTLQDLKKIGLDKMLISCISVMELYKGRANKKELKKLEQRIKSYRILDFDADVSRMAKRFMYD